MSTEESFSLLFQDRQLVITGNEEIKKPSIVLTRNRPSEASLSLNVSMTDGAVYEKKIYAIIGSISLLGAEYLILVTSSTSVASIASCPIFRINEVEVIPIQIPQFKNPQQKRDEEKYIELINHSYNSGLFYYSRSYDLSNSLQRQSQFNGGQLPFAKATNSPKPINLWNNIDDRFAWNSHLMEKFLPIQAELGNWFVPVIQGFVKSNIDCRILNTTLNFALISRRSKKRAGTRFHMRGSDPDGSVANYVETEQILEFSDGTFSSFVQIRGSIPLYWSQEPTMAYEPPIKIDSASSETPFQKHFEEELKRYGFLVVVDLLKEKGKENQLHLEFEKRVKALPADKVGYIYYDLHHHCGTSRFDKLSILMDELNSQQYLTKLGFFVYKGGKVVKEQKGVIRSNCKDCLDRTNLTQGLFAQYSLVQQLIELNVIKMKSELDNDKKFMFFFRNIWADNGDDLSTFYAGTGAIRSDVTRFGKGSIRGLFNDAANSVTRYYLNNFQDGFKQNALNLITNRYVIDPEEPSPFLDSGAIWLVSLLVVIFKTFAPHRVQTFLDAISVIVWVFIFFFLAIIFRVNKRFLLNHPTLINRTKSIKKKNE